MKHSEQTIDGPRGAQLYTQRWLPEHECRAMIAICHGLAEHGSRYRHVADHLVNEDFGVYAIDHLGHGRSEGKRCHAESLDDFLHPLHQLIERAKSEQPGKPVFLLGHSMGGLIASLYLLQHQDELNGAILSAPLVLTATTPSGLESFLIRQCSRFLPSMGLLQLDPSGVSSNPSVVADYRDDPLVYSGKVSARLILELGRGVRRLLDNMNDITFPLLILQGGKDVMVSPKGAELLHQSAESSDKTLEMFDDSYHEILNEPDYKQQALQTLADWLSRHL